MIFTRVIKNIADVFIPYACTGCGAKISSGNTVLCSGCSTKLQLLPQSLLDYFNKQKIDGTRIDRHFTPYRFSSDNPIRDIIHAFKFEKRFRLGSYLGSAVCQAIHTTEAEIKIDFIIPVPLHPTRYAERGFNQAESIASEVSGQLSVPLLKKNLRRDRYTKTQSQLKGEDERKVNVRGAFSAKNPETLKGKTILLIDDVFTTGSTLFECTKVLKKAGAAAVYTATAATVIPTAAK